jgi:hypothetical protein
MAYTTIDNPELHFQCKTYTGTGSSQSITLDGDENMQPDFVWIKNRSDAYDHVLFDVVRGVTKNLHSNETDAEVTEAQTLTAFNTDGFTVGTDGKVNASSNNMISWNWKMGTTSGITTNGSTTITPSSYSFNSTAGVSISQYTGNGTAGAKLAHGIGGEPNMFWVKQINGGNPWVVYFKSLGNTKVMYLNTNGASATRSNAWNDTSPDSVNITLGQGGGDINYDSSRNYLCFAMRNIVGFSRAGSYTGNGNADGTFVYTGFKPAFIMIKRTDASGDWGIFDNKREGYNDETNRLKPNGTDTEEDDNFMDIVSNGFKLRITSSSLNNSSGTYIFMAFAESPFVNSNGIPNNAR